MNESNSTEAVRPLSRREEEQAKRQQNWASMLSKMGDLKWSYEALKRDYLELKNELERLRKWCGETADLPDASEKLKTLVRFEQMDRKVQELKESVGNVQDSQVRLNRGLETFNAIHDGNGWGSFVYTLEQVCEKLDMDKEKIRELTACGHLPHVVSVSGDLLFDIYAVDRWGKASTYDLRPGTKCYPSEVKVCRVVPATNDIPIELSLVPNLCEMPLAFIPSCVYFLIKENKVVYVGESGRVMSRVSDHISMGKDFDRVMYVPVPESERLQVQDRFIVALDPPLNAESYAPKTIKANREKKLKKIGQTGANNND